MTEKARKVFEILGVEPNEKINIKNNLSNSLIPAIFWINDDLTIKCEEIPSLIGYQIEPLLNGTYTIVKLPKKKKLRDLTPEEYEKYKIKICPKGESDCCKHCMFRNVMCRTPSLSSSTWVLNKDLYSDKFLDQEIEVE